MLNITKTLDNGVLTVKPEGRLDTLSAHKFEESLRENIDSADTLILDFENLDYIASSGLRVLFNAHGIMEKKNGMKIINVSEAVMEVFELTNFVEVLCIE